MLLNRSIRSKVSLPPWLSSTEGVNQEQHRGWHRVVTLYATQLLNSLKCFPEPLCIHRVVGLSSIYGVVGPHATPFAGLVCRLSVIRTTSLLPLLQRGWRCGLPNASVPAHSKNLSVGAPSFGPFWYVFCTPLLGDPHVPHGHHRFLVACNDGIQWAG